MGEEKGRGTEGKTRGNWREDRVGDEGRGSEGRGEWEARRRGEGWKGEIEGHRRGERG